MARTVVLVLVIGVCGAPARMPTLGTLAEPWYTARATYSWRLPVRACGLPGIAETAAPDAAGPTLLFGDVNADGRDDAVSVCPAKGEWAVAQASDGAWGPAWTVWWRDGLASTAERYVADVDGDGRADAIGYDDAAGTWVVALSSGQGFVNRTVVPSGMAHCQGSAERLVGSDGGLWCVHTDKPGQELWVRFDWAHRGSSNSTLIAPPGATAFVRRWADPAIAATNNASLAAVGAVAMTTAGDVYVALSSNGSISTLGVWHLALGNFTPARVGAVCDGVLLAKPPPDVYLPDVGKASALICVEAASGYWHAAGLRLASSGGAEWQITTWKYSHGGHGEIEPPPAPNGHPHPIGKPLIHLPYWLNDFYLADPLGNGYPNPLACNLTAQGLDATPVCVVMSAPSTLQTPFQPRAPNQKSSNVNLWQAWHVWFSPLLASGGWGGYDSADLVQLRYMYDKLTNLGIEFMALDLTNGFGVDFGNTLAAAKSMAAFAAVYNKEAGRQRPIYVSIMAGVNPLGSCYDPTVLPRMEAQLAVVWQTFVNGSDVAPFYDPEDGRPLVILYVEPYFEFVFEAYMKEHPELTPYSRKFHIGYANGNNNEPGLWGWMIDRSCGPPHTPKDPCGSIADVGLRPDNETMYVSPAFARTTNTSQVYGARDIEWYESQFEVVATACPRRLVVGAFNDRSEFNGWWPAQCPHCTTGEESDPFLFWNATVRGLDAVRAACT